MESDKQLYEIFETNPQWIFELIERPSPGPCRFASMALKAIERRCDGVVVPDDDGQPLLVTEFQMQADQDIYNRIVIEMALIKGERPERNVEGLIIFGSRDLDTQTQPWSQVISVRYLDELLAQLARRRPTHSLVAVFQPLMEPNRDLLESRAVAYYNQIKTNTSDQRQQEKLLSVFFDWLAQRFAERGQQEIEKMLMGKLPHLRETQVGKELIALGIEQGIEIGIEKGIEKGMKKGLEKGSLVGTIMTCQRFLGFTPSEDSELQRLTMEELSKMADQLQATVASRQGG